MGKVQDTLEQNLTYFMANIGMLIKKFDDYLTAALPENPKSKDPTANQRATSPLLKRGASEMVLSDSDPVTKPTDATAAPTTTTTPAAEPKVAAAVSSPTSKPDIKAERVGKVQVKESAEDEEIVEITFPDNGELLKQLKLLKREAYELTTTFDGIHDWIALNIPTMKDEDNVGVEVMGAVIEQISSLNEAIREVYKLESKYLTERAESEKSVLKYPESSSLALQMEVGDMDTWDEVERSWRALIRVCLILYSVLSKNMAKLKEPRSENRATTMYH